MQISVKKYDGRVAAMVSGGIDSMVMLCALLDAGNDVFVVHVNHKIRDEADADCKFVRDFCGKKGVEFCSYEFDIPLLSKKNGLSLETEARLARRRVAEELLNGKADFVAFAHHADDNAETILMHIFRGSGIDGLRGIRENSRIVRPLIDHTREQIGAYAAERSVPFVEDRTNYDEAYTRNFIRHSVLPLIKTRYPAVVQTLNRLAENADETIDALDSFMDMSLITSGNGEVKLSLKALSSPLKARYVICAAKRLMPVDVSRAQIESVLNLSRSGAKAELANGLKAYRDYDCITFRFDSEKERIFLPFSEGEQRKCGKIISVVKVPPCPIKSKTIICADVPTDAVFRTRREGDIFKPFGGRSKSLKKYLIDKKIPCRERDDLVCLCRGNEVIAVVGVEISDNYKITPATTQAYLLSLREDV